ncbi:MAG: TIGR01458 family HAD-type hydrolase [Rhodospirillales bacterium]|nr:TIGR01458 family HAD-type hydrolase [Rhodospirillales bacterium]
MAIRGLLLDLQGVLYQDGKAYPGAPEAIAALSAQGLALRFLTNTTTRPRRDIAAHMQAMGFAVSEAQIFTPACAAVKLLASQGVNRVHLAAPAALIEEFAGFDLVDAPPEAIVLGDLHTEFTWARLDELFQLARGGARLIALHKNRYCLRDGKLALDLGPFVAALEYATNTQARVVGKPSLPFFLGAVQDMELSPDQVVMVGDDIEADIGGALAAGLAAVQVKTGKYRAEDETPTHAQPSGRIVSIAKLQEWLEKNH